MFPTESVLGLTECGLSPCFMSSLTARESEETWERLCGKGPSASTLVRISTEAGRRFEACSGDPMAELRAEEELHEHAVALLVSIVDSTVDARSDAGEAALHTLDPNASTSST